MENIRNITVIGAGAIGAAYASMLYDYDPGCVTILADGERCERYTRQGFRINGRKFDFRLARPEDVTGPADLVIVAVKYHHLHRAIEEMRPCVGPDTIILSLLNGISSEEIIGEAFGMRHVLYGMVVQIDAVREGGGIFFTSPGVIHFGEERNAEISPRVRAVRDLFGLAGIPCEIPENMVRTLWWKFMLNVGINQASAVLRAPYRVFQEVPQAKLLMDSAMREVVLVSRARGINLDEEDMRRAHEPISRLSPDGKTSMLQDVEAGRKTEVEMFAAEVVAQGRKFGIPTPVNETLLLMIEILEFDNISYKQANNDL